MADKSWQGNKLTQRPLLHLSNVWQRERETHWVYGLQIWSTESTTYSLEWCNCAGEKQQQKKHIYIKNKKLHILTEVMEQHKLL